MDMRGWSPSQSSIPVLVPGTGETTPSLSTSHAALGWSCSGYSEYLSGLADNINSIYNIILSVEFKKYY